MDMKKAPFLFAVALLITTNSQATAETQRLQVGVAPARMALLKPGSYRYLRYEVKGKARFAHDIWDRTVSYETKDGHRLLHITQRWDEVNVAPGKPSLVEQDSWFDALTFKPLTHERHVTTGADIKTTAYVFLRDKAVGDASIADNQDKGFSQTYFEPPFNFEYDMEMFQSLPLHADYEANIPFLDVGIDKKADRYTFKVEGSGSIVGWDGKRVECWIVTSDYNSGKIQSRWWIDKASQLVLREEANRDNVTVLAKTLLPPESGDKI